MSPICVDACLFFKTLEPTDIIIRTISKLYLNLEITNILHFFQSLSILSNCLLPDISTL